MHTFLVRYYLTFAVASLTLTFYTCFTCPTIPHTIFTADRKAKQQALTDASDPTGNTSTALQNNVFL